MDDIDFMEVFNKELIREQLLEDGQDTSDTLIEEIYSIKPENPWDAFIIWKLTKLASQIYTQEELNGKQSN